MIKKLSLSCKRGRLQQTTASEDACGIKCGIIAASKCGKQMRQASSLAENMKQASSLAKQLTKKII